ncbi:hypothetical protein Dimus_008472, partial [Dionaea muscipula]
ILSNTSTDCPISIVARKPNKHAVCDEDLSITVAENEKLRVVFPKGRELTKYFDLINAKTLEEYQITTVPHPLGENEVEIEAEEDSEDTQLDEVAEKVIETEEIATVPDVIEEGQPKKKHLKHVVRTGPATKRVRKNESPQPKLIRDESSPSVSEGAEEVGTAKNVPCPTAVELEVEVDSVLDEAIHHSFISDSVTLLDTLMQD